MKDHVFQLHSESHVLDQFDRTIETMDSYIGTNYKHCIDIQTMIEMLEEASIPVPNDPPARKMDTQKQIWQQQINGYVKMVAMYKQNKASFYSKV